MKQNSTVLDFNWNSQQHIDVPTTTQLAVEPTVEQIKKMELVSEDLRDGLQGASQFPSAREMIDYVALMSDFGIKRATVGIYTGEGNKVDRTVRDVLKRMRISTPEVTPTVVSLAHEDSVKWAMKCKEINPKLEVYVFMGTSPIRDLIEDWNLQYVLTQLSSSIESLAKQGVTVLAVPEHATQTPPDILKTVIQTQINHGAKAICIADTVGIARPIGVYRIVQYVKNVVLSPEQKNNIKVEWHGHRDLGNDVGNALVAIASGVDRIHTVSRGIGERTGNTQLESIILNLVAILQDNKIEPIWHLQKLIDLLQMYDSIINDDPPSYGPLSQRFNHTSVGVHCAAIEKAMELAKKYENNPEVAKEYEKLARLVYSPFDPKIVGVDKISIGVGPFSGKNSVILAYKLMGGDSKLLSQDIIEKVLDFAKEAGRELSSDELLRFLPGLPKSEKTILKPYNRNGALQTKQ